MVSKDMPEYISNSVTYPTAIHHKLGVMARGANSFDILLCSPWHPYSTAVYWRDYKFRDGSLSFTGVWNYILPG
ncbi:hypothetical protein TNCV_4510931 [Trichonephila clavipes]|nr:hypothetical protein TNCV_4510931 [Trichonephila clavipes]